MIYPNDFDDTLTLTQGFSDVESTTLIASISWVSQPLLQLQLLTLLVSGVNYQTTMITNYLFSEHQLNLLGRNY